MESQYTVHVIDDDDSFRKAAGRLLEAGGFKVALYSSAMEFLERDLENSPGCMLLDVHMPSLSGLELQSLLNNRKSTLPIVFISGAGNIPMSVAAIKAGANDFLSKPVAKEELFPAVRNAIAEYDKLHEHQTQIKRHQHLLDTLTKREREVLGLLITGLLNKQIAAELGTSERTIKAHRKQIMEKMKADSLAELVAAMTRF